jgi:NADPH2:quinone reductase
VIVTGDQDLAEEVMRLTGGRGARSPFDPVCGRGVETLAAALTEGGTIFLHGALAPEPTPFRLFPALAKNLTLRGYTLFSVTGDPQRLARGKRFAIEGLTDETFKPLIARSFPLEEIVEAHQYLESNQQVGKVIVTI